MPRPNHLFRTWFAHGGGYANCYEYVQATGRALCLRCDLTTQNTSMSELCDTFSCSKLPRCRYLRQLTGSLPLSFTDLSRLEAFSVVDSPDLIIDTVPDLSNFTTLRWLFVLSSPV